MNADLIDTIADIITRRGAESYLGEAVTMEQHMLQAAYRAELEGGSDEEIAAALLHDIGHYCGDFPEDAMEQGVDGLHERAGARLLASHFPNSVVAAVGLHVAAKRYLCAQEPGYQEGLSAASKQSLALQGGPMSEEEVQQFERNAHWEMSVKVRRWDEAAKVPDVETPDFAHYLPLLRRLAQA